MFEKIYDIAKTKLASVDKTINGLPEPQVTVLFSAQNNHYIAVNDIDGLICNELKNKNDTQIVNILTMWKSGCVDIASFDFRKALIEMDESNCDTMILLQGKEGYVLRKLYETV